MPFIYEGFWFLASVVNLTDSVCEFEQYQNLNAQHHHWHYGSDQFHDVIEIVQFSFKFIDQGTNPYHGFGMPFTYEGI